MRQSKSNDRWTLIGDAIDNDDIRARTRHKQILDTNTNKTTVHKIVCRRTETAVSEYAVCIQSWMLKRTHLQGL